MAEKRNLDRPEREKSLIRSMFSNNEVLQRALRQYFFQLPLNDEQEQALKTLTPEQLEILRREILPAISDDRPVGMSNDVWTGLSADGGVTVTYPRILVRRLMIKYMKQQMDGLVTGNREFPLKLASFVDEEKMDKALEFKGVFDDLELYVKIASYLTIMATLELHLNSLWMVGNQEIKSPEEITKAIRKNSSE